MIYKKFNTTFNLPLLLAVAFFITTISVFAQRPGGTPTPGPGSGALQSVTTDSTLTGNGTTAAPLGVANNGVSTNKIADSAVTEIKLADGAITAPKLAAQNAPQSGQVLTFNGSGLSWQTPAVNNSGGLRFIDSLGNEVGLRFDQYSLALRYLSNYNLWIYFYVTPMEISDYGFTRYYESADCTGTAYMYYNSQGFEQEAKREGNLLYFPGGNRQIRNIQSYKLEGQQTCYQFTNYPNGIIQLEVAIPTTIPISDLGTPPFRLAR